MKVINNTPLLNFFTQVMSVSPHEVSDVTDILNTMAVVGALVFTLALSAPASVSYDELKAANDRILEDDSKFLEWWTHTSFLEGADPALQQPSARFAFYASLTVFITASQVLGIIITYVALILSKVRSGDAKQVRKHLGIWFRSARWAILILLVLLVLGVVFFFVTFLLLIVIKWPDAVVPIKGKDASHSSTVYGRAYLFNIMLIPMCFVIALPLSVARYRVEESQDKTDNQVVPADGVAEHPSDPPESGVLQ